MTYRRGEYANLKKAMRTATSKNFGLSFSGFDCSLLVCFGLLAVGVACFAVWQELFSMQMVSIVVGISSFGVCAFVLLLAIPHLMRRMLWLELQNGESPADVEPNWILERLINPSALSGVRFVMTVCFFSGTAVSIAGKVVASRNGIRYLVDGFTGEWLRGLSIDGVAVLVVLGIIPLLLVLSRVKVATDTMRLLAFIERVGYFAAVCGIGVFLLFGDGVLRRMQVFIAADVRYRMLGTAIGGFSFLVSAMIILVDVWCRIPEDAQQGHVGRKNPISRFCQSVMMIAPIVFAGVAVFLRVRLVM